LPDAIKDAKPEIDWRKIVGLRNVLVHEYFGVSAAVVWDIVQTKLEPLKTVCREALMDDSQGRAEDAPAR
jgi:uncharacterized protein with HEPN domain